MTGSFLAEPTVSAEVQELYDALGAQPDALLAQALPAAVREAVTYGRPVAG